MTTRIITDSNGRKRITNEPLLHPPLPVQPEHEMLTVTNQLRQAAQMALEALDSENPDIQLRAALTLRTVLAQQQAKPVASIYVNLVGDREFDDWKHDLPVGDNYLYTSPQRPWVGLTDEEIKEIHNASVGKDVGFATGLTEAKLKKKNTT